jgi:7-cyano-7-deazaguanine synthase in queuosine biosynthesis
MSQVVVAEPSIHRTDERTVVSVDVTVPDSPTRTVQYVLPPVAVHRQQVVDAMFVVGRLVAMKEGWPLILPGPVSRRLLDRAEILQDIMLEWYPWYTKPIPLDFEVAEPLDLPAERGVISTFTGGVDSFHTVLENRERLTELLFIHGVDIRLEETDFRMRVSKELTAAATDIGLPLLQVETNARDLTDPYASWGKKAHGSILSSVAILLAERADTFLIPGSRLRSTVRGVGWGSHVLIDRLNSTDYLSVVHDSADTTRHSKTARIAQSESALRYLRVCYSSTEEYNCGTCPKCRRTQLDLDLVGITDTNRIFAESVPIPQVLAEFEIPAPGALNFAKQTVRVARDLGRTDVVHALKRAIHRYEAEEVTRQALRLRYTLRRHPEFLEAFPPRQRRPSKPKPRRRAAPPPPPPPTLRAVIAHRLPESAAAPLRRLVRRTRAPKTSARTSTTG